MHTKNLQTNQVKIKPLSAARWVEAADFAGLYELNCINLVEQLMTGIDGIFTIDFGHTLCGLIYFRSKRTVFHCLPFSSKKNSDAVSIYNQVLPVLAEFLKPTNIFCIDGEAYGSLFIMKALKMNGKPPRIYTKYNLMQCEIPQSGVMTNQSGFVIKRCKTEDCDSVFELEKNYQKEEVIPEGLTVTDRQLYDAFRRHLQKDIIFMIVPWKDGIRGTVPIAKAAINSIGKNYCQIGGVYTDAPYRKKGFAKTLVNHLVKIIAGKKRTAVLFVKETNLAAIKVYGKLGFRSCGTYILSYYY